MDEEIAEEKNIQKALVEKYGLVWDTDEVQEDFKVIGFQSPFAIVERKSDSKKGTLRFTHEPRFYFEFKEGWD